MKYKVKYKRQFVKQNNNTRKIIKNSKQNRESSIGNDVNCTVGSDIEK